MGYIKETIEIVSNILDDNPQFRDMLELGNQYIFPYGDTSIRGFQLQGFPSQNVAKQYFNSEFPKVKHTSVDYNGQDGAILVDLGKGESLWDKYDIGPFDIVTNLGTLEHVGEGYAREDIMRAQYNAFKSVFESMNRDAIFVSTGPKVGHWPGHCPCYYTVEFYEELYRLHKFEKILGPMDYTYRMHPGEVDILSVATKPFDLNFISFELFSSIPGHYIV